MPRPDRPMVAVIESGSRLYGLARPDSDRDIRFIWRESKNDLCGLETPPQSFNSKEPDEQGWSLRMFMNLAAKGSPNILELLYADPRFVEDSSYQWAMLRSNRDLILSEQIRTKTIGFATGELRRLEKSFVSEKEYDYKAAMHCLRLLRQCHDLFLDKTFNPTLDNYRQLWLMNVRNGVQTFSFTMSQIDNALGMLKRVHCPFPEQPNFPEWNNLCIQLHDF